MNMGRIGTWALVVSIAGCGSRVLGDTGASDDGMSTGGDDGTSGGASASDGMRPEPPGPATTGPAPIPADDGSTAGPACEPGTVGECPCPDGQIGVTVCHDSGTWVPCNCPDPEPNCDGVLICADCQFCTTTRGCSAEYAACERTPGCDEFRQCTEGCDGDLACIDVCAVEAPAEVLVAGEAWLDCAFAECPNSCAP